MLEATKVITEETQLPMQCCIITHGRTLEACLSGRGWKQQLYYCVGVIFDHQEVNVHCAACHLILIKSVSYEKLLHLLVLQLLSTPQEGFWVQNPKMKWMLWGVFFPPQKQNIHTAKCWMELQCDGMSWMLQIKFAKEALSLSLRCKNASFVYFNSFLERGLNEGKSFLSLRFC